MMTKKEALGREEICKKLSSQGYVTYSDLLRYFDLHITADPEVIGYMIPGKGVIVVNKDLDIEQISVVVRHEILHEYLQHAERFEKHVGADKYKARSSAMHNDMNIAGDYEISNKGYTAADKKNISAIRLNGKLLQGLVTELDHPDWVDLSAEEMYDRLEDERKKSQEEFEKDLEELRKNETVVGYNDFVKLYKDGKLSKDMLDELKKVFGPTIDQNGD